MMDNRQYSKRSWSALVASTLLALCSAQQTWPRQIYNTETFTAPNLSISRTGQTAPGYLFLGPVGPATSVQAPIIMTDSNQLVWHGPTSNPQNFRTQTLQGKPVLSYWTGFGAVGSTFGHGYGSVQILDNTYKQVATICGPANFVTYDKSVYPGQTANACYLDNHESYITPDNTIVVTAFNVTRGDLSSVGGKKQGWLFDAQFYEIDIATQKVLFSWSHLNHLDQIPLNNSNYLNRTGSVSPLTLNGTTFGQSQSLPWDPFHINSVQPVSGGYLVNSRYYWSTFYISKKDGSVIWNFNGADKGSFKNGPRVSFQWQHMTRASDGFDPGADFVNLTLHDNANEPLPAFNFKAPTRGLKVSVNLKAKRTTLLKKLQDPNDVIYNPAQGSYQQLPGGNTLLGYGTIAKVKEFNGAGQVIYTAQFGNITNQLPPPVTNYRAYKDSWSATPYYAPKIRGGLTPTGGYYLYMSWNGATDYNFWRIYVGKTKEDLRVLTTVARTGFETTYVAHSTTDKYIMAEAMHGSTALRNTTIAPII